MPIRSRDPAPQVKGERVSWLVGGPRSGWFDCNEQAKQEASTSVMERKRLSRGIKVQAQAARISRGLLASMSGADATQATGFSRTILECGGSWRRRRFGEQHALTLKFEAAVRVSRSAWSSPVADASLFIRSIKLRSVFVGSGTTHQNGNGSQNCKGWHPHPRHPLCCILLSLYRAEEARKHRHQPITESSPTLAPKTRSLKLTVIH